MYKINQVIMEELKKITPEEKVILAGERKIDKDIYMSDSRNVIDAKKLLDVGKLISVRTHTRFVHFPEHSHNYVEVIYMCSGSLHHIVNGTEVILKEGELLLLNQHAIHQIMPAGEDDIAVNFIILPEFFDYALQMMEEDENLLREFIVNCLRGKENASSYLHFKVSQVLPVQNLVENLIWTILYKQPNKRSINQVTMGLLFLQLMNYIDKVDMDIADKSQKLMMNVLRYIEENYKEGELGEMADYLHCDMYWLSKEIKRRSNNTYTELVQRKRLNQAAYLLINTNLNVIDIAMAVGYDNISYFHRLFQSKYQLTPRQYRISNRNE